jgi:hypothetical protein
VSLLVHAADAQNWLRELVRLLADTFTSRAEFYTVLSEVDRAPTGRTVANPSEEELFINPIPSRIWNVPYSRNPQFTDRSESITRLAAELNLGPAAAVTQAIVGLGGIGKTQLVLEYCYLRRENYNVIWWIRAEKRKQRSPICWRSGGEWR